MIVLDMLHLVRCVKMGSDFEKCGYWPRELDCLFVHAAKRNFGGCSE